MAIEGTEKTDILIFDVGLGQSVFVFPHSHPEYGMLVDCGHTNDFHPIDFLIKRGYIKNNTLSNLTITNYDHDHFSGIGNLLQKVHIRTINFPNNLTSSELKKLKQNVTEELEHICQLKDRYIHPVPNYNPPYKAITFHVEKHHLDNHDTNNLSQVVFIEHHGSVICIPGDLEEKGWNALLANHPEVKVWLKKTVLFIASHHGRENGYHAPVFYHCSPECIVISDKTIVHDTQKDMSSIYAQHIKGDGITMHGQVSPKRKILTTRSDGHIWIQLHPTSSRHYHNFKHE